MVCKLLLIQLFLSECVGMPRVERYPDDGRSILTRQLADALGVGDRGCVVLSGEEQVRGPEPLAGEHEVLRGRRAFGKSPCREEEVAFDSLDLLDDGEGDEVDFALLDGIARAKESDLTLAKDARQVQPLKARNHREVDNRVGGTGRKAQKDLRLVPVPPAPLHDAVDALEGVSRLVELCQVKKMKHARQGREVFRVEDYLVADVILLQEPRELALRVSLLQDAQALPEPPEGVRRRDVHRGDDGLVAQKVERGIGEHRALEFFDLPFPEGNHKIGVPLGGRVQLGELELESVERLDLPGLPFTDLSLRVCHPHAEGDVFGTDDRLFDLHLALPLQYPSAISKRVIE